MSERIVQYFFAFPSPYAALADARIDDLVARAGYRLEPIPVVPPPLGPEPEGIAKMVQEFKRGHMLEDCARWAKRLGLRWYDGPALALDGAPSAEGWCFARDQGRERAYRRAVFEARWGAGRDISDHAVLGECAATAGLDRTAFAAALGEHRYAADLQKGLERAIAAQVFGVPLFVVHGKRFWGNDRLDFLAEEIASR
jgi:2-hydroxychromene-2-carboxylate isomerase